MTPSHGVRKDRPASHPHHVATVSWRNGGPDFPRGKYSREHTWTFDGGIVVAASPSPAVVPSPWSNPACVDPEEAFVASVASCHMLTFLWLASKAGYTIDGYEDHAAGVMTKNEQKTPWVSRITLNPRIEWSGERQPDSRQIAQLHHEAHQQCFIANSIKTEVVVTGCESPG
jgi:organic hydroperoxide reductase OsmC/OhrA